MPYAEVIYETGAKSVVSVDDVEAFKAGLAEQHRRATEGEHASEYQARPAERVKRVFMYDKHPAGDDPTNDVVSADKVSELITGMTKDNTLSAHQLVQALRDEISPVYPLDQGNHESMFKKSGTEMTDLSFLEGADND